MKLQNIQAAFKRYLFEEDNEIVAHIISTESLNSDNRLAVYRNAYRSRLVEALANDYPALSYVMGEDGFRDLSLAYLKAYPSTNYSLRWFGKQLPRFLDRPEPYDSERCLCDLVNFEWALVDAFDAKDIVALTTEDMTKVPPDVWPQLRLSLHPSVSRVTCSWNCLAMWLSMKNKAAIPTPQPLDTVVTYLIWRKGLKTLYRSLGADETDALNRVSQGTDFAGLCTGLTQWVPTEQTALRAASLLKTWLNEGLVTNLGYN